MVHQKFTWAELRRKASFEGFGNRKLNLEIRGVAVLDTTNFCINIKWNYETLDTTFVVVMIYGLNFYAKNGAILINNFQLNKRRQFFAK